MKKQYLAPQVLCVEIETTSMLCASPDDTPKSIEISLGDSEDTDEGFASHGFDVL